MTTTFIPSARMKMAEIITDPGILSIIERMNIKLGFGEASIEEICKRYGLSTNLFLMICNMYLSDTYEPDTETLTINDIPKIIGYLQKSHAYWIDSSFPKLHEDVHKMLDICDDLNKKILNKFYDDYDAEFKKHLDIEENQVFPYILALYEHKTDNKTVFKFDQIELYHNENNGALNDLKNIIIKYLPEKYTSTDRSEVLYDIFRLETDLKKHTMIENRILIPLVSKLKNDER